MKTLDTIMWSVFGTVSLIIWFIWLSGKTIHIGCEHYTHDTIHVFHFVPADIQIRKSEAVVKKLRKQTVRPHIVNNWDSLTMAYYLDSSITYPQFIDSLRRQCEVEDSMYKKSLRYKCPECRVN